VTGVVRSDKSRKKKPAKHHFYVAHPTTSLETTDAAGCGHPGRSCPPSPSTGIRNRHTPEARLLPATTDPTRNADNKIHPATAVETGTRGTPPRWRNERRTRRDSLDSPPFRTLPIGAT
jgi:hypothetical protein